MTRTVIGANTRARRPRRGKDTETEDEIPKPDGKTQGPRRPEMSLLQQRPSWAPTVRDQMRTEFCTSFIPASEGYGYMYSIFDIGGMGRNGQDNACTVAGDALCVLQLGTVSGSKRLILGYYDLYVKAIQRLRIEVKRLSEAQGQDVGAVTAAIYFLGICESYIHTRYDSRGFIEHMKGLLLIMEDHGSLLESQLPRTAVACFDHWRYVQALGYGLVARKYVHANRPVWDATVREGALSVTQLALQVPARMGELENMTRRVNLSGDSLITLRESDSIIQKALQLRQDLNEIVEHWRARASQPQWLPDDIHSYPDLAANLGDLVDVFPVSLSFADLQTAKIYRTYWIALLALDQAVLITCRDLLDYPRVEEYLEALDDHAIETLQSEAEWTALLLAQSLPYFCAACWNSSGAYGSLLPLHFLEQYFSWARPSVEERLAWCWRMKESVVLGYRVQRILKTDS